MDRQRPKIPAGEPVKVLKVRAGNPNLPVADPDNTNAKFILAWDAPVFLDKDGAEHLSAKIVRVKFKEGYMDLKILDDENGRGVEIHVSHSRSGIKVKPITGNVVEVKFDDLFR